MLGEKAHDHRWGCCWQAVVPRCFPRPLWLRSSDANSCCRPAAPVTGACRNPLSNLLYLTGTASVSVPTVLGRVVSDQGMSALWRGNFANCLRVSAHFLNRCMTQARWSHTSCCFHRCCLLTAAASSPLLPPHRCYLLTAAASSS